MNRQVHFYGCAKSSSAPTKKKLIILKAWGLTQGIRFVIKFCLGDSSSQLHHFLHLLPCRNSLSSLESPASSAPDPPPQSQPPTPPTSAGIHTVFHKVKYNSCIKRDQDINVLFLSLTDSFSS